VKIYQRGAINRGEYADKTPNVLFPKEAVFQYKKTNCWILARKEFIWFYPNELQTNSEYSLFFIARKLLHGECFVCALP
jgi:hypothetical protein